jgi:apolipoprotein N-acyltransferase
MVIHRWNDATAAFGEPTPRRLRQADKTILFGAGLSTPGQSRSYLNAAIILGSHPSKAFTQRIPVPIAMWKPFSTTGGVPLRFLGSGTTVVAGKRSAILICYEQLLTWPYIASALEQPGIFIRIANDYWATGTSIPAAQNACLQAWARLFGIPYISATNT